MWRVAARLCGRNAVKVYWLLSVAKLGRAITTALSHAKLYCSDGSHVSLWLPDANVKFLQGSNRNIQTAVVNVSVGAVFASFIVVLGHQAYKQLTASVFWQRYVSSLAIRKSDSQECLEEPIANQANSFSPDLGPEQASNMTEQLLPSLSTYVSTVSQF